MIQFEGDQALACSQEQAWAKLSDVRFLVQCIPGLEEAREPSETHAVCVLKPGVSFLRGNIEVTIERTGASAPEKLQYQLLSKGVGTSSEVKADLDLKNTEGGSQAHWRVEVVSLGGLLKLAPTGLVRGTAQKVIGDIWTEVAKKIGV